MITSYAITCDMHLQSWLDFRSQFWLWLCFVCCTQCYSSETIFRQYGEKCVVDGIPYTARSWFHWVKVIDWYCIPKDVPPMTIDKTTVKGGPIDVSWGDVVIFSVRTFCSGICFSFLMRASSDVRRMSSTRKKEGAWRDLSYLIHFQGRPRGRAEPEGKQLGSWGRTKQKPHGSYCILPWWSLPKVA